MSVINFNLPNLDIKGQATNMAYSTTFKKRRCGTSSIVVQTDKGRAFCNIGGYDTLHLCRNYKKVDVRIETVLVSKTEQVYKKSHTEQVYISKNSLSSPSDQEFDVGNSLSKSQRLDIGLAVARELKNAARRSYIDNNFKGKDITGLLVATHDDCALSTKNVALYAKTFNTSQASNDYISTFFVAQNARYGNDIALDAMPILKKPQKIFILLLLPALVVFQGKATFRNLSRYSSMSEKRFSRWYGRAFYFFTFNCLMLSDPLSKAGELIAALDASFMTKSGSHTEGLGNFWRGCIGRTEKGLEQLSLLNVVDLTANTAYALEARQTVDQKGKTRVDLYAEQVEAQAGELIKLGIKYVAEDAYYFKKKLTRSIIDLR